MNQIATILCSFMSWEKNGMRSTQGFNEATRFQIVDEALAFWGWDKMRHFVKLFDQGMAWVDF